MRGVLDGVFPGGGVVVVTGPEQHAATVRPRRPRSNQACQVCRAEPGVEHDPACPWALLRAAEARADELQREREARKQFEDDVQAEAQETGQLALALDRLKLIGLANMVSPLERERDEARGSAQRWQEECRAILDTATGFEQERNQARREADQLRAALRWYADPATYVEGNEPHPTEFATYITPIQEDNGDIARAALAGVQADKKDSA